MNAQAEAVETAVQPAPEAPKGKTREAETVEMSDGRKVEFVGKQKLLKEAGVLVHGQFIEIDSSTPEQIAHGHLAIRMDFRNGATRTYPLNRDIIHRYALHGGLQKYGDQLAGGVKLEDGSESQDLDDWAYETDQLHDQLKSGIWAKTRVGGGGGGVSVLIQALMEFTGRTAEEVRDFIKDWDPKTKAQMRLDPDIKPIVDRITAEKAAKAPKVDTASLKEKLRGLAA